MDKYKKNILISYFVLSIPSFIASFVIKTNDAQANYSFIVSGLRLLLAKNNQNLLEIALHNWSIVALAFISNFYTFGLAGFIIMPISFFIFGAAINTNISFLVILFTILEAASVSLSVVYSLNIAQKRKQEKISFKNMYINCLKILALNYVILLIAASIEVKILPKF